jgi:chemotaxis methyl-accepting protein methylase
MDDNAFRQLIKRFGLSWDGYRKVRKGVKKRLCRHMHQLGCRNVQAYFWSLDNNEETRQDCERLLTVSISRFFRDRKLWQYLEKEILPSIIRGHGKPMRVWSAGCALGEEVYSFKILWHAIVGCKGPLAKLEMVATDMNPDYLKRARAGTYPRSSLKEVPERWQDLYFKRKEGQRYGVVDYMKKGIVWQVGNVLSDSPGMDFQVIFLRNSLLTYYLEEIKAPAFQNVINSLAQDGFLIIGAHEKIPVAARGLLTSLGHPCVFQKEAP